MDIRTYPVTPVTPVTLDALRSENERLRNELDAMTAHWRNAENDANALRAEFASYQEHAKTFACKLKDDLDETRAELGKCVSENNQLTEHIAELQSDDVYIERKNLIAANVRLFHDNNALRAELDAQAKRHAEIIDQWKAEENMWRYYDKKQLAEIDKLRAELDAMRQAHSVIAARMAAMGC
jgi:chromosome segregation ATPase